MQATGTETVAQYLQSGWFSQFPHESFDPVINSFSALPHKFFEHLCLSVVMSTVSGYCATSLQAVPVGAPISAAQISLCEHPMAADSWGSQGSVRSSLSRMP